MLLQELGGQLKSIKYNENSCQKTINVYNLEIGEVEIPNFFSPNDDQVNDIFRPVLKIPISEEINIINLKILNRWGKEVYDSNQPWDGKINGQFAPAEVYYFSMTYQIGLGCLQTIKGDVTLMR
ncbi:MAG: gliding motility-associated C-terminal domain-containing protein [Saprospiraceae bacterium]|nr:gliding motility-associated C-terminal domain-containing protein [Saprospiraceae bacterium]